MAHEDKSIINWAIGLLSLVVAVYFISLAAGRGFKGQKLVGKV